MKASQDDTQRAHTNWVKSLNEAQLSCRKALKQETVDVSDSNRALWPAVPREAMTREHQTVAQCHAAVLDYAELIRPFKNRCAGKWTQELYHPHEFPDGDTLDIVLSEIESWSDRLYTERVGEEHELTGRKKQQKLRRVHIPSSYSRAFYNQLNDCRERLQLAADLENRTFPTEEEDPGLTHVN